MSKVSILTAAPTGKHCQLPLAETCLAPVLQSEFFAVVAILDGGSLSLEHAGFSFPIVARSIGAVDEFFVLGQQADGRWMLVDVDGSAPEDATRGPAWAEPFGDGADTFTGLSSLTNASLTEIEQSEANARSKEYGLWFHFGEPNWVQSPDAPKGEGWAFVARVDYPYYDSASTFVFFHRETRRLHFVLQYS